MPGVGSQMLDGGHKDRISHLVLYETAISSVVWDLIRLNFVVSGVCCMTWFIGSEVCVVTW